MQLFSSVNSSDWSLSFSKMPRVVLQKRNNRTHPYSRSHARPHFRFSLPARMSVVGADEAMESASKRAKLHEAQMIPGIDGHRIFGFPNTILTKLRYCEQLRYTSTAGAVNGYVFAANGIFDPDISGTGHQPMYRDNYAALYDQYVVIGSKITVTMTNLSTTATAVFGINGDDDSAGSATVATKMEQNNSVWTQLGPLGSGSDTKTLTCTFEPNRDFGVDAKADGASATVVGANPTELWCYQVFAAANNAATAALEFSVEIDYTVKFSELFTPTQN